MPGKKSNNSRPTSIEAELYFLIAKFLESGPCKESCEILKREIEEHKLVPKRVDWLGNEHDRSFQDFERNCSHIGPRHLLQICSSIGPILDREIPPNVPGIQSLLGAGRQSLLRRKENYQKPSTTVCFLASQKHGAPVYPSLLARQNYPPNITQVLLAREQSGFPRRSQTLSCKFNGRIQMYRRLLGHLSSVYCVLFDRTGQYVFTGADDLLVKIWCVKDGRLLATLRGHSAEITDMAVNYENTLIAAASCDKIIRVWCLKTLAPVAVLVGHTGIVTALRFCPYARGDKRYLISTGNDGCVCFWQWSIRSTTFNPKPMKFTERNKAGAQMVCASFSPGGIFLATGSTDHHVRVYNTLGFNGPEKICEIEAHTDRVDSVQFSSNSCSFITGSKDGTAMVWRYERQQWNTILLKMATKLAVTTTEVEDPKQPKFKVTMVGWSSDDTLVFTAVNDHSLKVWDSYTGQLRHVLLGHDDEVFVLETHPTDARILLSGGHDGRIILWDLVTGNSIKSFFNVIEGQGHGAVFDCKFSPDGMYFASTDSHGHLSLFGYGSNDNYKKVPEEQYFHTDYRPLIRDANHHVLDEQTQCAPHLMPPPFLVDIDGNPYPPNVQRLVPGRENCVDSQLVPYIAVFADGDSEILEPVRPFENGEHRPTIDEMIVRLQQQRHNPNQEQNGGPPPENRGHVSPRPSGHRLPAGHSPGHSRVGMRRNGDVEGVRQSSGNWQSRGGAQTEPPTWIKRTVVKTNSLLLRQDVNRRQTLGDFELAHYNREKKKRALLESRDNHCKKSPESLKRKRKLENQKKNKKPIRTRGVERSARSHVYGDDYEDPDDINLSTTDSSASNRASNSNNNNNLESWDSSDHSESDSGDYSDWTEEAGVSVETSTRPPRYSHRKKGKTSEEEEEERRKMIGESELRDRRNREARRISRAQVTNGGAIVECPPEFRPSEWLTGVVPRRAPYMPQIGDHVVYFWQGHQLYIQAVRRSRVYDVNLKSMPWKKLKLREQEVLKITNISYEICPPRLCCLSVTIIDPASGRPTDEDFVIRYHDMPDVIDFMVLRQVYDQSVAHNWKAADRFRSLIDDAWWQGSIEQQMPLHVELPDSMFQCFLALWDNGETEKMSPWDFEPIDEQRLPSNVGGSVEITPTERQSMMYIPREDEWPHTGRDHECERLIRGFQHVMKLPFGKPFATAVDLNIYPNYAMVVEFPVDLGMVVARLRNRFYRRIESIKFDIGFIEKNAKKFNERSSPIIKQAKLVTELCSTFLRDLTCDDIEDMYHQMIENRQSRSTESDSEEVTTAGSSCTFEETAERRSGRKRKVVNREAEKKRIRLETQQYTSKSWKPECMSFLNLIFECEDSTPFRNPVSLAEYPDYRNIIDHPMDLSTVKEKLQDNQYRSPIDFCKDMRSIFQNSRNYNTNKKSRIYSMTIRLSAMFEEQIRGIISDYRSAVKYEEKLKNNQYVSHRRRPVPVSEALSTSKKPKKLGRMSGSSSGRGTSLVARTHNSLMSSRQNGNSVHRVKPPYRSIRRGPTSNTNNHSRVHNSSDESVCRKKYSSTNGIVPKKSKRPVDFRKKERKKSKKSSQNPRLALQKKIKRAISMTNGGMHNHQPLTRSKTNTPDLKGRKGRRRRRVVNYKELDEGLDPEMFDDEEDDDGDISDMVHQPQTRTRSINKHTESETEVSSNGENHESYSAKKIRTALKIKKSVKSYSSEASTARRWSLRNSSSKNNTSASESSKDSDKTEVSESSSSSSEGMIKRTQRALRSAVMEVPPKSSSGSSSSSSSSSTSSRHNSDNSSLNTDGVSDEDGTRRSSRTSTQNNTRATRSALHPNMIRVELKPPSRLGRMQTRNRGQRTVLYQEDSDLEAEDGAHRNRHLEGNSSESTLGDNEMNIDDDEEEMIRSSTLRSRYKRARVLFSE